MCGRPRLQIWKQFITAHVLINVVLLITSVWLLSRFRKATKKYCCWKTPWGVTLNKWFWCARFCVWVRTQARWILSKYIPMIFTNALNACDRRSFSTYCLRSKLKAILAEYDSHCGLIYDAPQRGYWSVRKIRLFCKDRKCGSKLSLSWYKSWYHINMQQH